ncbi:MAG: hypothetical protein HGA45_40425, partial [Chloroflexales bacterium]|nr:hypothetical protein [Chloroflexales bacterium]
VQDPAGSPVTNVEVGTSAICCPSLTFDAGPASGFSFDDVTTDAAGIAELWLFSHPHQPYTVYVTPPVGSSFATFSLSNIAVSGNQELVAALQFVHAPPITTATVTPQPRAGGSYPGPVTVSLAASAASGFTIASTAYSLDGGPTQTYTTPFTVSGDGDHTVRYWSTDSAGVYEAPQTLALTIATNRAPTADAGGPYTVLVGQSATLSGTASDPDGDPLSYAWDLDGDGSFESPGQSASFSAAGRQPGIQPVGLNVCDTQGACASASASVVIASDLRVTTASPLPAGTARAPYSAALAATGGVAPYVWSVAGGALPPGLRLDPASGRISGTPLTVGTWRLRVALADAVSTTVTGDLLLRVAAPASTLWAWGWNGSGQLGDGTLVDQPSPSAVRGPGAVIDAGAGVAHSVALRGVGTVWAWGYDRNAELGVPPTETCVADDTRPCRKTPAPVPGLDDVVALSTGAYHTLAQRADGSLWAWGFNGYGAVGAPVETTCSAGVDCNYAPVPVQGLSDVAAFAGGHVHSLALKADGTVWAWGGNFYGQLGVPTTATCQYGHFCARTPQQVGGLSDMVAVAAGPTDRSDYSLALRADGTVWSWGANDHGQLGRATTSTCTYGMACGPTAGQVAGLGDVVALAAGVWHALALRADGTVWAWGENSEGALGDGGLTSRATPAQVPGLDQVVAVAAGSNFSLALRADGTVWAWGRNANGQLGDGGVTGSPRPIQVPGLRDVVAIRASNSHVLALGLRPAVPALRITTASPLPAGLVGDPYRTTFEATGGTPPYSWAVAPGSKLPTGLELAATGVLSGTPTAAGTFTFAIQVTDSAGTTAEGDYGLAP